MSIGFDNVTAGYGDRMILNDLSFDIEQGQRVSLVGHNGAGKSTILKAITGQINVRQGAVRYGGRDLGSLSPENRVKLGVVQVPAGRRVFPQLSVEKNLRIGAFCRKDADGIEADLQKYFARFPVLERKARQRAGTLSGGEQQMLALARALMARPKLLLVDEPSLGLSPLMVEEVFAHLASLGEEQVTVILAEQNVRMALQATDEAVVLSQGAIQIRMSAEDLMKDEEFRQAYLGV